MKPVIEHRQRLAPVERTNAVQALVSVVIPCYNYARFLPYAVSSALSQEGVAVEVIVVDDASNDDSAAVARHLEAEHPDVQVISHASNKGPVDTFNDGLAVATGEFIVRLDADDMLTPGSLSRSVALAQHFPSVGLIYGHPVHFVEALGRPDIENTWGKPVVVTPGQLPPYDPNVRSWTVWPGMSWLTDRCRTGLNVITSPEVLMRASVVAEVGGQKQLPHTHDMEMWLRMAAVSDVGHIDGADQAWHRDHAKSLSQTISSPLDAWRARQLAFDTLFGCELPSLISRSDLREAACRAIASNVLREASHSYDRGRATNDAIDGAEDFASAIYPNVVKTAEWRGLQRRKRMSTKFAVNKSPYVLAAVSQRLTHEYTLSRWMRWGV